MNFVVAHAIRLPPIKVTNRWLFRHYYALFASSCSLTYPRKSSSILRKRGRKLAKYNYVHLEMKLLFNRSINIFVRSLKDLFILNVFGDRSRRQLD